MSAAKIEPGENWFDSIRDAIAGSSLCIIVLTDENELSRWIYFEAGAIAFNTKSSHIIPLLITSREVDRESPLNHYHYIKNSPQELKDLFRIVKKIGRLTGVREDDFEARFNALYPMFNGKVQSVLEKSITGAVSNIPFGRVFPNDTMQVEVGKVFFGAPMASHRSAADYALARTELKGVIEAVEICCPSVRRAYWAGSEIVSSDRFDGEQVALLRDLGQLKSSDSCIFVLFEKLPTSVLIEIGYAIALGKTIVIFCKARSDLPFLLRRADKQITNMSIYECDSYADIVQVVDRDGEAILRHINNTSTDR